MECQVCGSTKAVAVCAAHLPILATLLDAKPAAATVNCPDCGKVLKNAVGLNLHRQQKHQAAKTKPKVRRKAG